MKKFLLWLLVSIFFVALIYLTYIYSHIGVGYLFCLGALIPCFIISQIRGDKIKWLSVIIYIFLMFFVGGQVSENAKKYPEIIYIVVTYFMTIFRYREPETTAKSIFPEGVEDFFRQVKW